MRTIVKGKNIDVPDNIRAYAERKLARLERILDDRSDALVELSVEQHRSAGGLAHRRGHPRDRRPDAADATPPGRPIAPASTRSSTSSSGAPSTTARSRGSGPGPTQEKAILRQLADGTSETARERRIVKTKRFAIEPMFEEDAVARMEELGHQFFVFVDAENERVADPLSPQRRRLRPDRADRRRRVHEGSRPAAAVERAPLSERRAGRGRSVGRGGRLRSSAAARR